MKQIMSMTDEELLMDLVKSSDKPVCEKCGVPIQRAITGYNIITNGESAVYCDDCYYSYDPLKNAIDAFLANPANCSQVAESELFTGYL